MRHNWAVWVLIVSGCYQAFMSFDIAVNGATRTDRTIGVVLGLLLVFVIWSAV